MSIGDIDMALHNIGYNNNCDTCDKYEHVSMNMGILVNILFIVKEQTFEAYFLDVKESDR